MKIFCDACGKHVDFFIEPPRLSADRKHIYADLICVSMHIIISFTEMEIGKKYSVQEEK